MIFPETISRATYIDRIKPFVRKSLIKVLSGQRRVGKSYLLFQIISFIQSLDPRANIIYINKEDFQFDMIRDAASLHEYILSKSKTDIHNYIFIDEVQDIAEFEKTLRSLLLDENNDLYVTGSNANLLSGELATYLSGRYIEFKVYSLSYSEFLHFHKLNDNAPALESYIKFGGLPYLIHLGLTDTSLEYLYSIYNTIVYRDVVTRYSLRNNQFLEKLIEFLADNIGSLFSAKRISDFLKSQHTNMPPNQIQQYCAHLANAFIIHEVNRYDLIGRKIFEIGSKFYFENTGIRNVIIGYKIKDRGKLLENIVYNQLLYLGYDVKVGSFHAQEIDFVCERDNERLYIQVALRLDGQATIEREFGNLLAISDNYPKIVISEDHFSGNTYQGIRHMQIRDFLLVKSPFETT
ncbi:ATP-binding protein [Flavitalea sp. BT771]|uniref:ATP-binding protein n=1 Tax=Flavitalea sp. BT771 TaxID=3063329 RepID=UPI0026E22547|nr:ATP-binding protein [Flavitalea sp. BT771]MDO6429372.1 ATP-binding protein [Flavitalea sp. BT771]MDV6218500.1 ATP-binding protein [Flavitalea sp. BT771]